MGRDLQPLLDALSSPIRREILWLIRDRELAAGEIAASFDVTGPTISQHLAILRDAGLIDRRVDGTFRRYRARLDRLRGLESVVASDDRWRPVDDLADTGHATTTLGLVVSTWADAPLDPTEAFARFTDPTLYAAWLGVPVSLVDGRFACTLEWGTRVRGTYDVVVPPSFIVMRWDFEDDNVPVPGEERTAYLRITAVALGSRVSVDQLVADEREAEFMTVAWRMVLGRFERHAAGQTRRGRTTRPSSSEA